MMHDIQQSAVRNGLFSALSAHDFAKLQPHLQNKSVRYHQILAEPGQRIDHVYFPESGTISVIASEIGEIEVGVIGKEGCLGASVLLDVSCAPVTACARMPGEGLTLPAPILLDAAAQSASLRRTFLRYLHAFWVQTAEAVYASARCSVEQRLARSLLLYHDRVDGDELTLTHEVLATMLGVRRPGVTVATHVLEGDGLIRARRGRITILDRAKLERLAAASYGSAEAAYERALGLPIRRERPRAALPLDCAPA